MRTLLAIAVLLLSPALAQGQCTGGTYTLTIPAGTSVVMGESSLTLYITIQNNASSSKSIGYVKLHFNPSVYYISHSSTAPSGWSITEVKNAGSGQTYIVYEADSASDRIAPGESLQFNVVLTGNQNNQPADIPADVQDVLDEVGDAPHYAELKESSAKKAPCFDPLNNQDTWLRRSLHAQISVSPQSGGSGDTVDVHLTVTNRSSATHTVNVLSMSVQTLEGTATASLLNGPTPAQATLEPGEAQTFSWNYELSGSGALRFCGSAQDDASSPTATSPTVCSSAVAVGDFTATLSLSPEQIISGQEVEVVMEVANHGETTLSDITPSELTFTGSGSSAAALQSGPQPASIGSLLPGSSATFQWTYAVTGSVGDTFSLSGYAEDGTGLRTKPEPATSNEGLISSYSVSLSPSVVGAGSTNITYTFRVFNGGDYGVFKVKITTPGADFLYASASGGCATSWSVSTADTPTEITFETSEGAPDPGGCPDCIAADSYCDFKITYSAVPTEAGTYNFRVDVWDELLEKPNDDPRASLGAEARISQYGVTVEAIPSSIAPTCSAVIVATIAPSAPEGAQVDFSSTAGTLEPLSSSIVNSTFGGSTYSEAYTTLLAPSGIANATVTATYQDGQGQVVVDFSATGACPKTLLWKESY